LFSSLTFALVVLGWVFLVEVEELRHTTTTKTEKASEKRTNSNYQETEGKEN
jgi:hypothetical protein